jgi:hypothetical protein
MQNASMTSGTHGHPPCLCACAASEAVWIVSTLPSLSPPGVTDAGANVAVALVGNPAALSATALLKSPFTEPTVTRYVASAP